MARFLGIACSILVIASPLNLAQATCIPQMIQSIFRASILTKNEQILTSKVRNAKWFHADPQVRKLAYETFREALPIRWQALDDFATLRGHDVKALITKLAALSPAERHAILASKEIWEDWQMRQLVESLDTAELIQGKRMDLDRLKNLEAIKGELSRQGIESEIAVSRTLNSMHPQGAGVLVIKKLPSTGVGRVGPRAPIFSSPEFENFFKEIKKDGGALIVDPETLESGTDAYYWSGSGLDGANYVIAVKPDTNWSTWLHEWEHKKDHFGKGGEALKGDIRFEVKQKQASSLRKYFYRKGEALELHYSSELNATRRQLEFYFETHQFPPVDVFNTLAYRGKNQIKVGLGRFYMDPAHPKHLVLALRGVGNLIIPSTAVGLAVPFIAFAMAQPHGRLPENEKTKYDSSIYILDPDGNLKGESESAPTSAKPSAPLPAASTSPAAQ